LVNGSQELKYPETDDELLEFLRCEMWDVKRTVEIQITNLKVQRKTPIYVALQKKLESLEADRINSNIKHATLTMRHVNNLITSNPITLLEKELLDSIRQTYSEFLEEAEVERSLNEIDYNAPENLQIRLIESVETKFQMIERDISNMEQFINKLSQFDQELTNSVIITVVSITVVSETIEEITDPITKQALLIKLSALSKKSNDLKINYFTKKLTFFVIPQDIVGQKFDKGVKLPNGKIKIQAILNQSIRSLQRILLEYPDRADEIRLTICEYEKKVEEVKKSKTQLAPPTNP
jgi:hypothetical protein